jgi:hypothetical protein
MPEKKSRNVDPDVAHARARLAALCFRSTDAAAIEEARAALKAANQRAAAMKAVAAVLALTGGGDHAPAA